MITINFKSKISQTIAQVVGLLLLLSLSVLFNQNGDFWDNTFHSYYNLFFVWLVGTFIILFDKRQWQLNYVDVAVFVLLGYSFVSRFSRIPHLEDLSNLFTIAFITYYFAIRNINWRPDAVKIYYIGVAIIGVIISLHALLQYSGIIELQNYFYSMTGTFFNPGPLAGFLSLILPATLFLAFQLYASNRAISVILFLAALIILLTIFLASSRAALLGSCLSIVVVINHIKRMRKWVYVFVVAFPLLLLCVTAIHKDTGSFQGRLLIWKVSAAGFKKDMIWGIGYNQFKVAYGKYQAAYFEQGFGSEEEKQLAGLTFHAFNEPLKYVVEHGIIGLILLILCGYFIITGWKQSNQRSYDVITLGMTVAFFVFSLLSYPLHFTCFKVLLLNHVAIYSSTVLTTREVKKLGGIFLSISIFLLIVFGGVRSYVGASYWWKASGNKHRSVQDYEIAYKYLEHNGAFLNDYAAFLQKDDVNKSTELFTMALKTFNYPMLFQNLAFNYEHKKNYVEAEKMFLTAHYMVPNKLSSKEILMDFYRRRKDDAKVVYWAKEILQNPIKINTSESRRIQMKAGLYVKEYRGVSEN